MLAASPVLAKKQAQENVIIADSAEKFAVLVDKIRSQMATGQRYEFLSPADRKLVNDSLDKMGSLLNQLINSRDPAQRAQIRAALAPLRKERDILSGDWIRPRPGFQAVNTVSAGRGLSVGGTERLIQNVGEAKSTYDLAQWTESTSGDFERL